MCSRRRIIAAWCGIVIGLFALDCHLLYGYTLNVVFLRTTGLPVSYCDAVGEGINAAYISFFSRKWFWIDGTVRDFVPFLVIFVGNISIFIKLFIASRQRSRQMQAGGANNDKAMGKKVRCIAIRLLIFRWLQFKLLKKFICSSTLTVKHSKPVMKSYCV